MVIALVVAHLWGVLQLILLGSLARTVRARTVYAALAAGLYLCAPVTVVLQKSVTALLAAALDLSTAHVLDVASYTLDPFIEEIMKVLPLVLLLWVPVFRRQWSLTDCVLIGAATGAGFGLAEDLYRFGGAADHAQSLTGGWELVFSGHSMWVSGIGHLLTSWLPHGVAWTGAAARLNEHLLWSAAVGLAVGLVTLVRTRAACWIALGLTVCVSLDHAAGNMTDVADSWLAYLAWPLRAFAHLRPVLPLAALGAAWWLDRRRQGADAALGPLLTVERSGESRLRGLAVAAFSRAPGSFFEVERFVRLRRALRTEQAAAPNGTTAALLVAARDRTDRELTRLQNDAPTPWPKGWPVGALRDALRRPAVILWLVVTTPSMMYFVVGGWPQTAGLQALMRLPLVATLVFPLSVLAQAWIAWRTLAAVKTWSGTLGAATGDESALVGLRVACGLGAVSLGVFSLWRLLGGVAPGASLLASLHAQSAADRLTPGDGSMLANSAGALAPPPASAARPGNAAPAADLGAQAPPPPSLDLPDHGVDSPAAAPPAARPSASPPPTAPDPVAVADAAEQRAADAAADARQRAEDANDAIADAEQRRRDAQNAAESSQIKQAAGAEGDPSVVAAESRVRAAHDAADAADIKAADDFQDPWSDKAPAQAAADETRAESKAAEAARAGARSDAEQKLIDDAKTAGAAEQQADDDLSAAAGKAGQAKADADAKQAAAQRAAEHSAAAHRQAADPRGAAAGEAERAAAAAQKAADQAFLDTSDPTGQRYHAANEAARQARQQADAARSDADPFKP